MAGTVRVTGPSSEVFFRGNFFFLTRGFLAVFPLYVSSPLPYERTGTQSLFSCPNIILCPLWP